MKPGEAQDVFAPKGSFDFSFPSIDTFLRLETQKDRIVVRATRNSFSESRKQSFLREMAAEGFIEELQRTRGRFDDPCFRGVPAVPVCWLVDSTWLMPGKAARARTNSFMVYLMVGAALLWLIQLVVLFLFSR